MPLAPHATARLETAMPGAVNAKPDGSLGRVAVAARTVAELMTFQKSVAADLN